MTKILLITICTQLILILGGYGLLQLLVSKHIRFLLWWPLCWGAGCLLLYLLGGFFVLTDLFLGRWHWAVAAICLGMAGLALWRRGTLTKDELTADAPAFRWRWFHHLLVVLIIGKIVLVGFASVHNPVIDSDATLYNNYVSIAKKIGNGLSRNAVIAENPQFERGLKSPLGPSVLSAYPRLFIDRWHNQAASVPWLFCYLSILGLVFFFSFTISKRLTVSLALTYLLSAVPMLSNHTVRPGFNDLLVCCFLMMAFGAVAVFIQEGGLSKFKPKFGPWITLMLIGALGASLSKPEGMVWSFWLALIFLSYVLNVRKKISWPKIIGGQAVLAALLLVVWYTYGESFLSSYGGRAMQLAPATALDPRSWEMTVNLFFKWGAFNLLWWIGAVGALLALFYAESQKRAFIFYLLSMMAVLVFLANLTQNQEFTIAGTTLGRFLLHLLIVPLLTSLFAINVLQDKKVLEYA